MADGPMWRIVAEQRSRSGRRCGEWRAVDHHGQTVGFATFDGPLTCDWVEGTLQVIPGPTATDVGVELLRRLVAGAGAAGAARVRLEYLPSHKISTEILHRSALPWRCQRNPERDRPVRGSIECAKHKKVTI